MARRGAPESPDDLRSHECIVVASDIGPDPWIFGGRRGPEEVAVGGRLRVNSFRMAHQAAVAGVSIVRIARFIAEADVSAGRLVEVLPAYRSVTDLVAVFAKSKPVPAKVRAFVDLLVDHFLRGAHGKRRR